MREKNKQFLRRYKYILLGSPILCAGRIPTYNKFSCNTTLTHIIINVYNMCARNVNSVPRSEKSKNRFRPHCALPAVASNRIFFFFFNNLKTVILSTWIYIREAAAGPTRVGNGSVFSKEKTVHTTPISALKHTHTPPIIYYTYSWPFPNVFSGHIVSQWKKNVRYDAFMGKNTSDVHIFYNILYYV